METKASQAVIGTATCPRCSGRGLVLCPQCQGTGDERNASYVVTGPCRLCAVYKPYVRRGFATCPKCQGRGTIPAVRFQ